MCPRYCLLVWVLSWRKLDYFCGLIPYVGLSAISSISISPSTSMSCLLERLIFLIVSVAILLASLTTIVAVPRLNPLHFLEVHCNICNWRSLGIGLNGLGSVIIACNLFRTVLTKMEAMLTPTALLCDSILLWY